MNYISATLGAILIMLVFPTARQGLENLNNAPLFLYLGGVFGAIAFFLNITSLHKMNLFQSGILILIGQLCTSFILDLTFGFTYSFTKLLGIIILSIGVVYDKKVSF